MNVYDLRRAVVFSGEIMKGSWAGQKIRKDIFKINVSERGRSSWMPLLVLKHRNAVFFNVIFFLSR